MSAPLKKLGGNMRRSPEEVKKSVLQILKLNYGKAVSRESLSMLAHASDRSVRKAIEELRREGEPIGQAPNGGYSYGIERDVKKTIGDYYAKAYSSLATARALEGIPLDGQITIEDLKGI